MCLGAGAKIKHTDSLRLPSLPLMSVVNNSSSAPLQIVCEPLDVHDDRSAYTLVLVVHYVLGGVVVLSQTAAFGGV